VGSDSTRCPNKAHWAKRQPGNCPAMDFGIHIGTRGCLTTRENIMAMASSAEASGYAIIGVADHLIVPVHTDVRYPYTADGIWPGAPTGECFDAIATLTFLAGFTQRIRLLTSVLVVPYRPAVLTAKLLTTADALSGGRVIAGVGSGWMKEEFAALDTPPFEDRGAVTDEYIRAWKSLWTEERPSIDGRFCEVRQCGVQAETGFKATSADLGRRRECSRAAARRSGWRRVVSGVEQRAHPDEHPCPAESGYRSAAPSL